MADVRRQTIDGGWQVRWPVMDDGMWTVRGVHSQSPMTLGCLSAAALRE